MLLSTASSISVVGAFVIVAIKAAKTLDREAEVLMLKVPLVAKFPPGSRNCREGILVR
jgi:hypothetical protein